MATDFLVLRYPTKGARKVIERQARRLPSGFRQAMDALSDIHLEELKEATPEGETKKLKQGWRVRKSGAGGRARYVVYNTEGKRLGYVVKGTPAHTIRATHTIKEGPRKGQQGYLKFRGKGGGFVYRRAVRHPGTKPNPFHRTALARSRRRRAGAMHKIIVRTLKG